MIKPLERNTSKIHYVHWSFSIIFKYEKRKHKRHFVIFYTHRSSRKPCLLHSVRLRTQNCCFIPRIQILIEGLLIAIVNDERGRFKWLPLCALQVVWQIFTLLLGTSDTAVGLQAKSIATWLDPTPSPLSCLHGCTGGLCWSNVLFNVSYLFGSIYFSCLGLESFTRRPFIPSIFECSAHPDWFPLGLCLTVPSVCIE